MVNIDPHSLYYSCIYHQVWQTSVATVCMPMSSQLQGRWVRVCRVRTKDMELLTLSVLYWQGSDAGQKYFKIYWIFKFAVPLWLTRVRSDLVATQDCSPILYEYLLKYSDLHLEDLWRTSCYMYPPQNSQYWPAFPIIFLYLPPKFDRLLWLNNACPCLPIYGVGRYGYVAYA